MFDEKNLKSIQGFKLEEIRIKSFVTKLNFDLIVKIKGGDMLNLEGSDVVVSACDNRTGSRFLPCNTC